MRPFALRDIYARITAGHLVGRDAKKSAMECSRRWREAVLAPESRVLRFGPPGTLFKAYSAANTQSDASAAANIYTGAATANDWCKHVWKLDNFNYKPEQLNKSFFFYYILTTINVKK
jgi:hypothetical protein